MNTYEPQERHSCNTMKIVREEMRKSYRNVQKEKQEKQFNANREQFLLAFQRHGLQEQSPLIQDYNYWFLQPSKHAIAPYLDPQVVFDRCLHKEKFLSTTVGTFVDLLIREMEQIHLQCLNFDVDQSIANESEKIINDCIKTIKSSKQYEIEQQQKKIQQQNNFIDVFYVVDKSYKHDIFNYYNLKYKANVISKYGQQLNESVTVYSDKQQQNQKTCRLQIDEQTDSVEIQILGKKQNEKSKEYQLLSTIQIPLYEILSAIQPIQFENPMIPPSFLIIPYNVMSDIKFSDTRNPIEIELGFIFDISLSYRSFILEQHALPFYTLEKRRQQNNINNLTNLINHILSYFEDVKLQYKLQDGIEIKKHKMESGCYASCNIF